MTTIHPFVGVFRAALGERVVVYDPTDESTHILDGPVAAWVLALEEPTPLDTLVAELSAVSGAEPRQVRAAVTGTLELFDTLGLDRTRLPEAPEPWPGSTLEPAGRHVGQTHAVIERTFSFRSTDPGVLAELDRLFGPARPGAEPTVVIDADPEPDGRLLMTAAQEWDFPSPADCLAQIMNVVNEYGARSDDTVVLHASGVRTPSGEVWLIPGAIDAGKSTLAGALVQAGCDYLGDESIGIRAGTLEAVGYPKASPWTAPAAGSWAWSPARCPTPSSPRSDPTPSRSPKPDRSAGCCCRRTGRTNRSPYRTWRRPPP